MAVIRSFLMAGAAMGLVPPAPPPTVRFESSNAVYGRVNSSGVVSLGVFDEIELCVNACVASGRRGCGAVTWHTPSYPDPTFARHCYGLVSYFDWFPTQQDAVTSVRLEWPCAGDSDCSQNGKCNEGSCDCNAGWSGHACQSLDLEPVNPSKFGFRSVVEGSNRSTWGGAIIRQVVDHDKAIFHMYASEITKGCGMNAWCQNSQIVHAIATDASGPYHRHDVVFPPFAHEPSIAFDPTNRTYVMFFTAQIPDTRKICDVCANGTTLGPCPDANQCSPNTDPTYMSYSAYPSGPWSDPVMVLGSTGSDTNLSPWILNNGSLVAIWRSFAPTSAHPWFGSKMHMLTASRWDDPSTYHIHVDRNLFPSLGDSTGTNGAEDPFLWRDDKTGTYHALLHNMYGCGTALGSRPCGSHAWSPDGWTWHLSGSGAYGPIVQLTTGSSITAAARERPHLLFAPNSTNPTHLITGVVMDGDASATLVQSTRHRPMKQQSQDHKRAPDRHVAPNSPLIRGIGRHLVNKTALTFDWVGTGMSVRVSVSPQAGTAGLWALVDAPKHTRFSVFVDANQTRDFFASGGGPQEIPLLLLDRKRVTASEGHISAVTLLKTTENPHSTTRPVHVLGLRSSGFVLLPQNPPTTRRIVVYGDSDSAGYGVDGASDRPVECLIKGLGMENFAHGWVHLAASALGADASVVAVSGIGVVQNAVGGLGCATQKTLPEIHNRTLFSVDEADFDPRSWNTSIIVIYLGSNDFIAVFPPSDDAFKTAYSTFLNDIVAPYGGHGAVPVLHVCGGEDRPCSLIRSVVEGVPGSVYTETGDKGQAKGGCIGHRNTTQQANLARLMVPIIASTARWNHTH